MPKKTLENNLRIIRENLSTADFNDLKRKLSSYDFVVKKKFLKDSYDVYPADKKGKIKIGFIEDKNNNLSISVANSVISQYHKRFIDCIEAFVSKYS